MMNAEIEYLENSDIYAAIIEEGVLRAVDSVWIATANVKNLRVKWRKRAVSIISVFERLVRQGVDIRMLHGAPASVSFTARLGRSKLLRVSPLFSMVRCPRIHMKVIVVDNRKAYMGSANLTGAGLGIKYETQRNFETGIVTRDAVLVDKLGAFFDFLWRGEMCTDCSLRAICPKPIQ